MLRCKSRVCWSVVLSLKLASVTDLIVWCDVVCRVVCTAPHRLRLSFFLCRTVDGTSYLVADFTLQCGSEEWNKYLPLAIVAVLVYPIGIPCALFIALYRVRRRLKHPHVQMSYGLAYEAYLNEYWWWELIDMTQKLFLTSLLGFFPASAQCGVGMTVCILYLLALLIADPYVRRIDDRLCCTVEVSHSLSSQPASL